jgi:hypothetical protein
MEGDVACGRSTAGRTRGRVRSQRDLVERGRLEALGPRSLDAESVSLAGGADDLGVAGETLALVTGDRERFVVGTLDPLPARVRGAIRVASSSSMR